MNPFEEKLTKQAEKTVSAEEEMIKDVKLLLEENAAQDISTLRSIGLSYDLDYVASKKHSVIMRNDFGKRLERTIVSRKEIEDLCLKYRLYMRPTTQYRGVIPAELGAELTRYYRYQ